MPRIEYISDGVWTELYGHACFTVKAAQAYCDRFNTALGFQKFRLMK